MSDKQSHFIVIESNMTHIGDNPDALSGNYTGEIYYKQFNLPANVDIEELAVMQCRTFHNQSEGKRFYLNLELLGNILEKHPNNKNEWMMDHAIVPSSRLRAGMNSIHIGYESSDMDDFVFDNIVLWYKTFKILEVVPPIDIDPVVVVWPRLVEEFSKKLEEHKDFTFIEKQKLKKKK